MRIWYAYRNMSIQGKASIWYTICNFLNKGISFIVIPIYVRLLTTAEYGAWSVFQSWRDILIIFASLNLYCGVYTKTLVDNKNDRDKYTSSMQGLGTVITLVLFGVYSFFSEWCNTKIGLSSPEMMLLFAYFIVYPAFSFWSARQRVEYKYKPMVAVTILLSVLTPVVSIFLLQNTALREKALVYAYLFIQCSIGIVFYIYQFWKGKCFFHKKYWIYALKYNIPLVPHYLSLIVLGQSDRIMIKHYCGESDAGIYSFAYQIASAINVFITAINGSRVPWTYERLKAKAYERLRDVSSALVLLMAGIVFFVSLISPEVITILGTTEYETAMYVIPVVTLGVFYTFVYDLYASIEFYFGATKYVMYASVIGALLNICLNAIFIPRYGFIAAAYTTLICYLVFMIMHFFFSKRVLKEQNISDRIYANKVIFLISIIITGISLGCMLSFPYPIFRAAFVIGLIAICFIMRSKIMPLFKTIKERKV